MLACRIDKAVCPNQHPFAKGERECPSDLKRAWRSAVRITEGAWGTLWSDDSISKRKRSMLTLSLLAATGNFDEIPMHVRATANTGASPQDVLQAFMHVAVYAGVPKANHAIKLAKQTYAEMGISI